MVAPAKSGVAIRQAVLDQVDRDGWACIDDVLLDSIDFGRSLGEIFQAHPEDDPVVSMIIEGDDPAAIPYASCRTDRLSLHTDYATFALPPRYTITHCIRPDPLWPDYGRSIVIPIAPVIAGLANQRPQLLDFLRNQSLPFQRNAEHGRYHHDVPQWTILDDQDRVRYDRTLIEPVLEARQDHEALERVREFDDYCESSPHLIEIALKARQALIVDNRKVIHSRSECSYSPEADVLLNRHVNLVFLQ